ncbi:hypothetical protein Tco_0955098 [Tanacetum coccineum]|uniref:Uncharacterized protein n=1 Tax=Tanacetum coccineum TaxID=301880 RepID=A0ABQ5E688_9ASTR
MRSRFTIELPWDANGPIVKGRSSGPTSPINVPGLGARAGTTFARLRDASPTAQSPDYVPESDPEADPKEDDDEDPTEDPVDYPADGGDDGDDEEGSSEDDEDDDMDIKADDEEEEEEHLAPRLCSFYGTPLPYLAYHVTCRFQFRAPVPTPVWSDAEVARLLAISTPPSSHFSPWVPPPPFSPLPQIPSRSLPLSPPSPVLSPAPPPSPICIALGPRYEVGESSSAAAARPAGGLRADYGFVATMDRETADPRESILTGYARRGRYGDVIERAGGEGCDLRDAEGKRGDLQRLKVEDKLIVPDSITYTDNVQTYSGPSVGQVTTLQGQVTALQGQVTALQGQQGPAGGPAQPELPEEAGSSS